jgi:hypothetical protein
MPGGPAPYIPVNEALRVLERNKDDLSRVLRIKWDSRRDGKNSTAYWGAEMKTEAGQWVPCQFMFYGERQGSWIQPTREEDLAEINARIQGKYTVKQRETDPTFTVTKWAANVESDENLNVMQYPPDDKKSKLFAVNDYLDQFFTEEIERMKDENKIVSADELNSMNKKVKSGKMKEEELKEIKSKKIYTFPSDKIVDLVQRTVSDKKKDQQNAGKDLPNPITRFRIRTKRNTETGEFTRCKFLDYDTRHVQKDKGVKFEDLLDENGEPINNDNIHRALTSGCELDGKIDARSICSSNFGISWPRELVLAVVKKSKGGGEDVTAGDMYSADDLDTSKLDVKDQGEPAEAEAEAGTGASEAKTSEEDVEGLLSDIAD